MRDIRFRAWDVENGYMITSKQGVFTALRNVMDITRQDDGYYNNGELLKPNKNKYELMQFTGLYDKNKVPIYEGDIVLIRRSSLMEKHIVKFDKGCFYAGEHWGSSTRNTPKLIQSKLTEVIGNIYDNPDLLGE